MFNLKGEIHLMDKNIPNNKELLRMTLESQVTPTQEFTDTVTTMCESLYLKLGIDKAYDIEGMVKDSVCVVIKHRVKYLESKNNRSLYSYYNTIIKSNFAKWIHNTKKGK